ncbi:MAG: hypothetical protein WC728_15170 [Elusimicrobiota bacterium]
MILATLLLTALSPAAGASSSGTLDSVLIDRRDVFDPSVPGEDSWMFRTANRLHVRTREAVVRRDLLLGPGDAWDPLEALETERNLRSLPFLREAELSRQGSALSVRTRDSWTLLPRVSIGTEGGDTSFGYGIEERNLLGFGKTVKLAHSKSEGETRDEARYYDPRLLGTWWNLDGFYADVEGGREKGARLRRPFFSLRTAAAADSSWANTARDDVLRQGALETSRFSHAFRGFQANLGGRVVGHGTLTHRALVGAAYERHRFSALHDTAPGTLPPDRTLAGPWAGYELLQADYRKETEIDTTQRVEDFNLGNELFLKTGPALRSWGSGRDLWLLSAVDRHGLPLGEGRFALAQAGATARLSRTGAENGVFFASLNLFCKLRAPSRQTLVAHLEFNDSRRLDGERQFILGGATGLRGYKNDSFTGTRAVLANVEDRFFLDRDFLHLFYLGGVVFLDSGSVAPDWRFKTDVGLGLRVSPSRSASGRVLRADVAYALQDGPGPDRWVVSLQAGQAFSIGGSANRRALARPDEGLAVDEEDFLRR